LRNATFEHHLKANRISGTRCFVLATADDADQAREAGKRYCDFGDREKSVGVLHLASLP
jgi:hypothetical protein